MERKSGTATTGSTFTALSPLPTRETKDVPLKTFDELYGEVCSELREAGKSIDLCEKMKVAQSDLKRVQVLLMYNSSVVRKFTNYIGERYEGKSEAKSRELLSLAKSLTMKEVDKAIELLTQALLLSPWRSTMKQSQEEIQDFFLSQTVNDHSVGWLLSRISQLNDGDGGQEVRKEAGTTTTTLDPQSSNSPQSPESQDSPTHPNGTAKTKPKSKTKTKLVGHPSVNLLAQIYFERANHLSQRGNHENAILDCVRAIICCDEGEGEEKLTFATVFAVGVSLKAIGYFHEATLVFHHALQLLRQDSTADNQTKSRETIKVVRLLKELNVSVSQGQADQQEQREGVRVLPGDARPRLHLRPLDQDQEQNGEKMTDTFGQLSPILIAASDALDIKYDRNKGRHAVAKKTIPPGATLIVDTPYSWSLYPQMYERLCLHCCRNVVSGIPCQHCSSVVFCKWECWQRSEEYHKFECPILKGLDSSEALGEMALLCFRTVCKTDVRLLESWADAPQGESNGEGGGTAQEQQDVVFSMSNNSERVRRMLGLDAGGTLDPQKFSSLLALTPNSEQRPIGDIIKRSLAAIYLTLCLRYTGYPQPQHSPPQHREPLLQPPAEPLFPPDGRQQEDEESNGDDQLSALELKIAAVILRLSQSLSCNAYGMNSILPPRPSSAESHSHKLQPIEQLGGATYPTVSIVNHSCNPNVYRFTYGNLCIVRSILEIQEGEEILDSYGPTYTIMEREERKSRLGAQYFFRCDCVACEGDWSEYKDLKGSQACQVGGETIYKCSGCGKSLRVTRKKKDKSNCTHCGERVDLRRVIQLLSDSERKYLVVKESLISTGAIDADGETALSHHISILQKFLTSPHRLIVECQETLKLAWNLSIANNSQ